MAKGKEYRRRIEFGDFQTPVSLARQICRLLFRRGLRPAGIVEPNCGQGAFLLAAIESFPDAAEVIGIDINEEYVSNARSAVSENTASGRSIRILREDFFNIHWNRFLKSLPAPILVIGNPPWVTNAGLGSIGGSNLPAKSNFQNRRGLDAITGKSNFDISEWMLIQLLESLCGRQATLAMLCKTTVARKVLSHAWKSKLSLKQAEMYLIDAHKHFGAAVDACLLIVTSHNCKGNDCTDCCLYSSLQAESPVATFGYRDKHLVSHIDLYEQWKHLQGRGYYGWRSGIKHDCVKVMELNEENGRYRNGFGKLFDLEPDYLYPVLKSSDIAKQKNPLPSRWMLVTQQHIGENTDYIKHTAPKTWQYLMQHAAYLDRRASSVYHKHPKFSIFGVGDYSFANWKLVTSGFYKSFDFKVVGPYKGKPVVLDDTGYFIACRTREEAILLFRLLNSDPAKAFFSAFIFWDEKRPITLKLLSRLNILALAQELGIQDTGSEFLYEHAGTAQQLLPFP